MNTLEGNLIAKGLKIGIVGARFNEFITSKLISGAMDALVRHDVKEEDVDVAWVPGAFEIPLVAKKMAESGKYDAVICLGAVIRGATSHYDLVCNEAAKGIAHVSLDTGIPVMFGIVTTDTSSKPSSAQARRRATRASIARRVLLRWLIFWKSNLTIDFKVDTASCESGSLNILRFLSRTEVRSIAHQVQALVLAASR